MSKLSFFTEEQIKLIQAPIPEENILRLEDGTKYVNTNYVGYILDKVFDHAWNWVVIDKGIEEARVVGKALREGKKSGECGYYAWVLGELSYPAIHPITKEIVFFKKQAFGTKDIVGTSKVQNQDFKAAGSDALKKAASMIGIARNVYMKDEYYENLLKEQQKDITWNETTKQKFAKQLGIFKQVKDQIGQEKLKEIVVNFCDETEDYSTYGAILPDNINHFIKYLVDNNIISLGDRPQ